MLTLSQALKSGKIAEFIQQEEARGIGPAESPELEEAIKIMATTPTKSADQTSRLPSHGGSRGK
jgi:hypothetical protein